MSTEVSVPLINAPETSAPHLRRVLGRWDLVLLFVVAVFNLNVVPSIAANGGVTVWLWLISLLLFFWPQDRKSTRLNSSHQIISYAVFCLKKTHQGAFLWGHGKTPPLAPLTNTTAHNG